ncbi:MAG: hypothetical protein HY337_05920 [Gemmatimonadetes bacterium]|nr:hypothetical protein [Gemmatimonadota bacterium]
MQRYRCPRQPQARVGQEPLLNFVGQQVERALRPRRAHDVIQSCECP